MIQNTTRQRKISFELFVALWNIHQDMDTPAIHWRMIRWLARQSRGLSKRLLLMAFRGCGKSTLTGLFCAWQLCQNPDMRILIVSADEGLAENMLRHIRHILETHPIAAPLIPQKKQLWSSDRLLIERTHISRDPSLRACGIHSTITGARADLIICDDVEVPNTCDTEHKRTQLRKALNELDFILTPSGSILYIGTPHTEESLYAADGYLKNYTRLALPLTPESWPERFTPKAIDLLRTHVGLRVFTSQMLLQPVRLNDVRLNPDMMQTYDTPPLFSARSCYWDPAFGHNTGDQSVVALVGSTGTHDIYLDNLLILPKTHQQEDAARNQCQKVADFILCHNITQIIIETNGLGQFLPGLLSTHLKERHISCAIIKHHAAHAKTTRILHAFEARLAARAIHVRHNIDHRDAMARQMRDWNPTQPHNADDILDACAGAIQALVPRRHTATTYHIRTDTHHDT